MRSIEAAPSEQCPNCFKWYRMGDCRHSSTRDSGDGFSSTLYGVCSKCAESHSMTWKDGVDAAIRRASIQKAPDETAVSASPLKKDTTDE